ncbi:MAG TPA: Xaa-Pro peptidase family protein [Longimicrobiales bacterium]
MKRRDFLVRGAAGTLGAAVVGLPVPLPSRVPTSAPGAGAARLQREPSPISEAEYAERRAKAQRLMGEQGMAALFIEPGANLLYFSGIRWGRSERLFGMLLPQRGAPVFVVPGFETARAAAQIAGRFEIRSWEEDASPYRLIADTLAGQGVRTGSVGLDESARYFVAVELGKVAPGLHVVDASPVTHLCRGVKSAHEIEIMRYANEVTLRTFRSALSTLDSGMTQSDLSRAIAESFRKLGYDGYALVLFAESSASPHGLPQPRALRPGDVVLVDGGCTVLGYEADITRTVVFGQATAEQQRVWDIVHRAQAAALAAARPGVPAGAVDAAARQVIAEGGFGPGFRFFTHRLGHGIGLEGHEWPYLVPGSDVVLRPGMTFSDEPGIYQPGKFGVRTEDVMVVTENGAELLTPPATSLSPALA